ncbi:MAG: aminotransferase class V-fold PLP-dependent enzyme [Patescibacteria group bacterium]
MLGKPKRVYLDWAASAPISGRAKSVLSASLGVFGNPGALHQEAQVARVLLEEARTKLARLVEVKEDGVIFTSGATEANALAILGLVRAEVQKGSRLPHVLYHPGAHASLVGSIAMLKEGGVEIEALPLSKGAVDLEKLVTTLKPTTTLVVLEAVCGETGMVYDTRGVRRALDAYAKKTGTRIYLHVDASQAPLTQNLTLAHLGADLVTLDAQKVGGVRGIGALLLRQHITLVPLMRGGGQEGGRRPGTENPVLAHAFVTALTEVQKNREVFTKEGTRLRAHLTKLLTEIPRLEVNEHSENVPNILNISLLGRDTDYAVMLLDASGFAVSTKSACETDEQGSRPVALMKDTEHAETTLRISWGPGITEKELVRFASTLVGVTRFLDEKALY